MATCGSRSRLLLAIAAALGAAACSDATPAATPAGGLPDVHAGLDIVVHFGDVSAKPDIAKTQTDIADGSADLLADGALDAPAPAKDVAADTPAPTEDSAPGEDVSADAEDSAACNGAEAITETCNGLDDDCDGVTDEQNAVGCKVYYFDNDGDGFGTGDGLCLCANPGLMTAKGGDCNDDDSSVSPDAIDVCNGKDDNCDGVTDAGFGDLDKDGVPDCVDPDIDGDGTANAQDCAPTDAAVHPGAVEVCNGADDDCNGQTDEAGAVGCTVSWPDGDGDGFGKAGAASACLCSAAGAAKAGDCNDSDASVHPGAAEICNDVDDNCDGTVDEGCDKDQDGWCASDAVIVGNPAVCKAGKQDCDDANAAIHPGQPETCGNGIDDDCDGLTDSGANLKNCLVFFLDGDQDGWGAGEGVCQCAASGAFSALQNGDCNDGSVAAHPGASEVCDGLDNDCNGQTDEGAAGGCTAFYADADGDGYGDPGKTACLCSAGAAFPTALGGDCDDTKKTKNPGLIEVCDGIDNNCNGKIDEDGATGCKVWFVDSDGDGYGDASKPVCQCGPGGPTQTQQGGDCNDSYFAANPGASEICDGVDNDCDGTIDEAGALGCTAWLRDADGDGYGVTGDSQCLCAQSGLYKAQSGGDCDDGKGSVHPGATETCNGVDDNCDGVTDPANADGCSVYFVDGDGDGFGQSAVTPKCLCGPGEGYTALAGGDCDDNDAAVSPAAAETCDGKDNNCDGFTDPKGSVGCTTYYLDSDGDGFGAIGSAQCTCSAQGSYVATQGGDCNDQASAVHPGVTEVCNGVDDDCDGLTDNGASGTVLYYLDGDGDGWGSGAGQLACGPAGLLTATQSGDCDDGKPSVHPGAAEVCNGIDDNCNGSVDDGLPTATYYFDGDGDGFGTSATKVACGPGGGYGATQSGDCDDTKASVHPGATEITCNGIDENCDGSDACACTASTLFGFESNTSGWAVGSGWRRDSWLKTEGSWALVYEKGTTTCGYSYTGGSTSSYSFVVPLGAKQIAIDEKMQNVICDFGDCTWDAVDTSSVLTLTLDGSDIVLGPYSNYPNNGTRSWVISPSQWGKTVKFSAKIATQSSDDCLGGFGIDNLRVTCN